MAVSLPPGISAVRQRLFSSQQQQQQSKEGLPATASSSNNSIWKQLATFATIGATCLAAANYLTTSSGRDGGSDSGPVPAQATITSRVYLDVTIDQQPVGRIVLGLYGDVVPRTVANFEALCRGDTVYDHRLRMCYQNTLFHRIIPGFMLQSGDFILNNGTGGRSIYGGDREDGRFADENFTLRHVGPGVVSMANAGPNTNGSQFFIAVAKTPHLDGKHVVFGTVTEGWNVVQQIEACGTSSGRPTATVRIAACGMLPAVEEPTEAAAAAGEEEIIASTVP